MAGNNQGPPTRPSLLVRLRDPRDDAAWKTFVDVYGPLVYHYCLSKRLQPADAAEVMQEVLLQVHLSMPTFDYQPEKGRFRDWLGRVTHNKLCSFLKKKNNQVQALGQGEEADLLESVVSPAQETAWREAFLRHILQIALGRIRPHFEDATWKAFEAVWLHNRPAAEVAHELGKDVNWVYMAKSRVLKRLEEEIRELTDDSPL